MSAPQFTPGPWSLDDTRYRTGHEVRQNVLDANGGVVLAVPADRTFAAHEANAHLISAAPELYEALEEFLHVFDKDSLLQCDPELQAVAEKAATAIAKARGQ